MSVTLHTTHGPIKIEVFCDVQKTAYNFLALAASGAYNSSPFHRSIQGFVLQGGSVPAPAGGKLSKIPPSTSIYGDAFEDEIRPTLRHNARGIVSMANKGPGTNGSQFFILYKAAPHLDGHNSVFGKVIEGLDVLDVLESIPTDGKNRPSERIAIETVTMHANPLADQ